MRLILHINIVIYYINLSVGVIYEKASI